MKPVIDEKEILQYKITYGPRKESDREVKTFTDQAEAKKFFEEKDKAGMHVSVYETIVYVKITQTQIA